MYMYMYVYNVCVHVLAAAFFLLRKTGVVFRPSCFVLPSLNK